MINNYAFTREDVYDIVYSYVVELGDRGFIDAEDTDKLLDRYDRLSNNETEGEIPEDELQIFFDNNKEFWEDVLTRAGYDEREIVQKIVDAFNNVM